MSFFIPNVRPRERGEGPGPESARIIERPLEQESPGWTYRRAADEFLKIPFPSESCPICPKVWFQNEVVKSLLSSTAADVKIYGRDFCREVASRTAGKKVGGFDAALWQKKSGDYWIGIEAVVDAVADEHRELRADHPGFTIETAFMNELDEKSKIDALMFALDPAGTNHDLRLIQTKATSLRTATAETVAAVVDAHRKWLASLPRTEVVEEYLHGKEARAMVARDLTVERPPRFVERGDRVIDIGERVATAIEALAKLGVTNGADRPKMKKFATGLSPRDFVELRLLFEGDVFSPEDRLFLELATDGVDRNVFAAMTAVLRRWAEDAHVSVAEIKSVNPNAQLPFPPRPISNVRSVIWHGRNRVVIPQPAALVVPLTYRP